MGYVPPPLPWQRYNMSYELCKKHNCSTNFTECNSCRDRFICWTAPKVLPQGSEYKIPR